MKNYYAKNLALSCERCPRIDNFVGYLHARTRARARACTQASAAPIYLWTRATGSANGESFCPWWREVSFGIRPSRRCALIVPGMNNELPAPLSLRRRKTLSNETARWEYEIVACVSACRVPGTHRHTPPCVLAVSFLAVARYLIFASPPFCHEENRRKLNTRDNKGPVRTRVETIAPRIAQCTRNIAHTRALARRILMYGRLYVLSRRVLWYRGSRCE
jgi:hypothetical protein